MAVDLHPGRDGLRPAEPVAIFEVPVVKLANIWTYDKIPGQDRFVVIVEAEETVEPWPGEVVLFLDGQRVRQEH